MTHSFRSLVLRSLIVPFAAGIVTACSGELPEGTLHANGLAPLPDPPDLELLDAPVSVQFRIRHGRVRQLTATFDTPVDDLATAWGELGMLYMAYGYWEPAAACLGNARALDTQDVRWAHLAGLLYRRLGDFSDSDQAFAAAATLDRRNVAALVWLAENALDRADFNAADGAFVRALAVDNKNTRALLGRGRVAIERSHYDGALEFVLQAQQQQPLAAEIQHALGLIYRELGNLEQAQAHFREARRSRTAQDSVVMADAYAEELETLRQGSKAHDYRALKAILSGDADTAIAEYRLALDADPEAYDVRYNLGLILIQTGHRDAGLEEFSTLLEQDPNHVPTLIRLGYERTMDQKLPEAESYIRHAVAADPGNVQAQLLLGDFLEHTGRHNEAILAYQAARTLDPEQEPAYIGEAISLMRADKVGQARQVIDTGLTVLPGSQSLRELRQNLEPRQ